MNEEQYNQLKGQEIITNQQIEADQGVQVPQIHEQMQQQQAILVEQTNPKRVVEDIMLRLRGLRRNTDGTESKIGEPKMNPIGIKEMWFKLESFINQNVILSHLNNREISKLMEFLSRSLVIDLQLNWKEYGITKKTDLDAINDTILGNIYLALKRAEGQGEKNWLGKISIEQISGAPRISSMKKEGFFQKFKL